VPIGAQVWKKDGEKFGWWEGGFRFRKTKRERKKTTRFIPRKKSLGTGTGSQKGRKRVAEKRR